MPVQVTRSVAARDHRVRAARARFLRQSNRPCVTLLAVRRRVLTRLLCVAYFLVLESCAKAETKADPPRSRSTTTTLAAPLESDWLAVLPAEARRGMQLVVAGSGFCADATVGFGYELEVGEPESRDLATLRATKVGVVQGTVRLPDDIAPGRYRLVARDVNGLTGPDCVYHTAAALFAVS